MRAVPERPTARRFATILQPPRRGLEYARTKKQEIGSCVLALLSIRLECTPPAAVHLVYVRQHDFRLIDALSRPRRLGSAP